MYKANKKKAKRLRATTFAIARTITIWGAIEKSKRWKIINWILNQQLFRFLGAPILSTAQCRWTLPVSNQR